METKIKVKKSEVLDKIKEIYESHVTGFETRLYLWLPSGDLEVCKMSQSWNPIPADGCECELLFSLGSNYVTGDYDGYEENLALALMELDYIDDDLSTFEDFEKSDYEWFEEFLLKEEIISDDQLDHASCYTDWMAFHEEDLDQIEEEIGRIEGVEMVDDLK